MATERLKKVYALTAAVRYIRGSADGDWEETFYIPARSSRSAQNYFLEHQSEFPLPEEDIIPPVNGRWDRVVRVEEIVSSVRGFTIRAVRNR